LYKDMRILYVIRAITAIYKYWGVVQLVERQALDLNVGGSIPSALTEEITNTKNRSRIMKRIYYLHDEGGHPIVTIGVFKDENKVAFARTISIYGEGEVHPLSKKQARNTVIARFENAKKILERESYVNELYPKRVRGLYSRLVKNERNEMRDIKDLFPLEGPLLKIDLNAVPTDFEKHLLKKTKE
jgi:hypothetical protein